MKTIPVTCFLCCVLVVVLGCQKNQSEDAPANQTSAVVPIEVAIIRQGDVGVTVDVVGQTEVLQKVAILSPVAGTMTSFKVLEGTAVLSGQVLAVILTKESQAAISGAQALLAAAVTPAEKKEAERSLELAKSSQNLVPVVAKSSGIVSSRSVVDGSLVAEGTELLTIVDPSSTDFVAQVSLKDLASVKIGQTANVVLSQIGHTGLSAVVSALSPQSDPQSQTVRVRLNFVNVPSEQRIYLKDGIAGTAHITVGAHTNVLLIPTRGLLRKDDNNTYTVVTVTKDSLSLSVPVTVGVIVDTTAEISSAALQAGMSVVTAGNYALADSTRVTVRTRKDQ